MLKIAWAPIYVHPLPEGHRFPMEKYQLIPEQLLYEGTIDDNQIFAPKLLEVEHLLLTHTLEYWIKLKEANLSALEIRRTGFPYSLALLERERIIMEGTRQSALFALEFGVSMNTAGGTHHAFTNFGEGFCLLNDVAIAANFLLHTKAVSKILIVDLDVHQGNGTAEIFKDTLNVFTWSVHCANNFPSKKEKSDLDTGLADKTGDDEYLRMIKEILPRLLQEQQPDFIFYLSGVDVLASDKLGKLSLTRGGCKERDRYVLETCKQNKIPVAISMGGGYSEKVSDIVEAHCNTFRLAQDIFF